MRRFSTTRLAVSVTVSLAVVVTSLVGARWAVAADSPIGTWIKKEEPGKPGMTLKIDQWGDGKAKLTYHIKDPPIVLTVLSALDGTEAPVLMNGRPSGETMAIKLIDKLHSVTVVKMDGKPFGTSTGTFSPDFKTLTVENDFSASPDGNRPGKSTEHWVRK
jgi:hypothetical protein